MKSFIFAATAALATTASAFANTTQAGFNYGVGNADGSCRFYDDFVRYFDAQKQQANASSARLYSTKQCGSNAPIEAIQAAIDTETDLMLGIWLADGDFDVELAALTQAVAIHGADLAERVVGISVGNEDLYKGQYTAGQIASYVQQVRSALVGTALEGCPLGHAETSPIWINGANRAMIEAVDFIGHNSYPFFVGLDISQAVSSYFSDVGSVEAVSQGKPVMVLETGWSTRGSAVASLSNAAAYYKGVVCAEHNVRNVWYYVLTDSNPGQQEFSFAVADNASLSPKFDLKC